MEKRVSEPKSENPINEFRPAEGEVIPAFSIPLLRGKISHLDQESMVNDCREWVGESKSRHGNDVGKNYTTYFDHDIRNKIFDTEWGNELTNVLKDTYIKFVNEIYAQPVDYLTRHDVHFFPWVSVYNTPHQHDVHNHVNSYMSGTFYVLGGRDAQPIKFFSPALMSNFSHNIQNEMIQDQDPQIKWMGSPMVHDEMFFHPDNGDFLLWPSYLQHMVPPNNHDVRGDYERIAISFNLNHIPHLEDGRNGTQMSYDFMRPEEQPNE